MGACAAQAGPTSEWNYLGDFQASTSKAGLATGGLQSSSGLATTFDSGDWSTSAGASSSVVDGRARVLDVATTPANTSPVVGTPAALDLTLWNFISNIRAQQTGNMFQSLRASSANIDYTLNGVPAPVPLPSTFWLFLAGVAGLCAMRLHGVFRREPGPPTSQTVTLNP